MKSVTTQSLLSSAVALHRAGRLEEALAHYRRAAAGSPADPICGMALAFALSALGRHAEAEAGLRALSVLHPRHPALLDMWGLVLLRCGRQADAIEATRRAVAADPKFTRGWCNQGLALLNSGLPTEALACFQRACGLDAKSAAAHHGRAMALQHLCRIPEAVEAYGRAIAADPANLEPRSYRLMALHYLEEISREELWAEHRAFGRAAGGANAPRALGPTICGTEGASSARGAFAPPRKLRVGFLSPDLREHSVAYFLEPLLAHLDRGQFEVVLYHDHFAVDAVSERLRTGARWRNLVGMPSAEAGRIIHSDGLDILVELAGHTGLNRLPLLAGRLAPVQISYLGYPDTTGVAAIDYRFVDAVTDPAPEADRFCSERLVRFAPTAWSYLPPAEAPACGEPRRPADGPVFGSCNNLAKLTADTLRGWSGLLRAVPDARLVLKTSGLSSPAVAADFRRRLEAAGIDLSRVELADRIPRLADHLAFYERIDVALDTFPYHGTTTTCEALWMGVPVVTLLGDRHCARVGGSLLAAIGRSEWVAADWADYIRIAARLAAERPGRAALRQRMAQSALLDHAAQARRFGQALARCWQERTAAPAEAAA